jgi:hypothetical protein
MPDYLLGSMTFQWPMKLVFDAQVPRYLLITLPKAQLYFTVPYCSNVSVDGFRPFSVLAKIPKGTDERTRGSLILSCKIFDLC